MQSSLDTKKTKIWNIFFWQIHSWIQKFSHDKWIKAHQSWPWIYLGFLLPLLHSVLLLLLHQQLMSLLFYFIHYITPKNPRKNSFSSYPQVSIKITVWKKFRNIRDLSGYKDFVKLNQHSNSISRSVMCLYFCTIGYWFSVSNVIWRARV